MSSNKSRQVVCVIDACYSGAASLNGSKSTRRSNNANIASATYDRVWKKVPKAEGKYFLLSSQSYEKSWAMESNSLYTKFILEGLRGIEVKVDKNGRDIQYSGSVDNSGNVTPESLHDYVYNKVASIRIGEEIEQVPKIKVDTRIFLYEESNLLVRGFFRPVPYLAFPLYRNSMKGNGTETHHTI
jgi:hypothetical protein